MNATQARTLEDYLALDYRLDVVADPDGGYVLVYPDLPGCMTQVETLEEVGAAAQEIRHLWIETQYEDGFPIPLSRFAMKLAEAGEPPCGCGPGATECDYHLGWWDGYAASRNQSVGHLVAVASEWHERDCNCLCDCGDCNKPADPCELGALLRGYGNVNTSEDKK